MKRFLSSKLVRSLAALVITIITCGITFRSFLVPVSVAASTTFSDGDVLVSVSNGQVQWRHADGTLNKTLSTGTGGYTTGMAFDAGGNLYVTNFSSNSVSKFDNSGNLTGNFGSGYNAAPESIVFDKDGNAYVGHADGARAIRKYDSSGNFKAAYQAQTDDRGTDWVDLADDQCTMYYTSEGPNVKRYNVCTNTQLSNFNTAPLPDSTAYALRILSTGGVMVADTSVIARLDTQGKLIQTYSVPGHNCWFALNLDPDAKSFWSADYCTSDVYKFDLATGNVLETFNTNTPPYTVFGLTVKGEITAAQPCALPAFGDSNGNPIQQLSDQMKVPYGGMEYNIPGKGVVFLPFRFPGENPGTIYQWGCNLISGTMIINYFAAQQGKSFRTDPITLNNWMAHNLTNNNLGYSSGEPRDDNIDAQNPDGHVNFQNPTHVDTAEVNPDTLDQYAKANGIDMALDGTTHYGRNANNDTLLNKAMCDLNPAMLAVNNSGHFIDATGKTNVRSIDTWRIHDPLSSAPTNLLDSYSNQYNQLMIFKGAKPRSAILLSLYSPAELIVTDPQGRRTGLDPRSGISYNEIPSSSYGQNFLASDVAPFSVMESKSLYIDSPQDGPYTIDIIGTGNGTVGIGIAPVDNNGDGQQTISTDTVAPGVDNAYKLNYSSTPGQGAQLVRPVTIDIKPGSDPASINLGSNGVTPVAILSSPTFDATKVDPASIIFAGTPVARKNDGTLMASFEDVNGDGRLDLVVQVNTKDLKLSTTDTQATLDGKTFENLSIRGTDSIKIVL